MDWQVLSAQEFYTRVADYMRRVDPSWDEENWQAQMADELRVLPSVMGEANGRSVLDCSCGSGGQAIPLAKLGWQVTAADITTACLDIARRRARQEGVGIVFRRCDMRHLDRYFQSSFDWAISCMALDNITADEEIQQAVRGMFGVLKPGGQCYIRLRDFDHIMDVKPRYDFKEERAVPHGRVIRLEDWAYESETHVLNTYVFLREDGRKTDWPWVTDVFSYQRRALCTAELERFLRAAGFQQVKFLPQPSPWHPYDVVASKAT
jgi:ubiquinone/menaquinone biosynthesis C-methylase UbiE